MNFLDLRTVFFTNVITFTICTVVVALLWHQSRNRFAGMSLLVIDFAMQAAATFLIAMRGFITDWMSIGLANILVFAGSILGYMGLERFVGKISSQIHNYIFLAFYGFVLSYFALNQTDLAVRNLAVSLGLLIIWFQCMWLMLYRVEPGMRPLTFGVGLVFGGLSLVNVVRIAEFFTSPHPVNDYFQSGAFQTLVIIVYQMLMILLTYSLALMVNKRLFVELKTHEEKFAKAFHSSPYAIVLTRLQNGRIMEVNEGFVNITGYRYDEVVGKTTFDLHIWASDEERAAIVDELLRNGKVQGKELHLKKKTGEIITGIFSAEVITINNEKCILTSVSDISERKRMEEEIREMSLRDSLTDLYNRRGFFTIAEQEIKKANRARKKMHLTFIDCDGLKWINDNLGHEEGDRALKVTADILRRTFRESDLIARVGGDEFAVLSIYTTDIDQEVFLRRLQQHIDEYNESGSRRYKLGMSWGTSVYDPESPIAFDELMAAADKLMYANKKGKAHARA
ncbi:MAG: sensor domain-containing diguanylate cyclase [Deltaproteobacteria bacterium]|nr:sensor domain-containing diguanylate cyclase [Deltaproteobacteria bacterium]